MTATGEAEVAVGTARTLKERFPIETDPESYFSRGNASHFAEYLSEKDSAPKKTLPQLIELKPIPSVDLFS